MMTALRGRRPRAARRATVRDHPGRRCTTRARASACCRAGKRIGVDDDAPRPAAAVRQRRRDRARPARRRQRRRASSADERARARRWASSARTSRRPDGFEDRGNHSCAARPRARSRAPSCASRGWRGSCAAARPCCRSRSRAASSTSTTTTRCCGAGYRGTTGIKTGYTDAAGRCLVATARRGPSRLGVVLLHSPDPGARRCKLLDRGFRLALSDHAPARPVPRGARRRDRRGQVALGGASGSRPTRSCPRTGCAPWSAPARTTMRASKRRVRACSTSSSPSALRRGLTTVVDTTGLERQAPRAPGARWPSATACPPTRSSSTPPAHVVRERNRARAARCRARSSPPAARGRGRAPSALRRRGLRRRARARPGRARAARVPGARRTPPPASARIRACSLRPAGLALRLPRPPGDDRRRRSRRSRAPPRRSASEPVGHGPLPPDPAGRARVGGHARELHDARLPRRRDRAHPAGHARHRHHLPQRRPPGEDRGDARRALRRAGRVRDRRGLVRARAPALRLGLPAAARALRAARGRARAAAADVGQGRAALRGAHAHRARGRSATRGRCRSASRSSSAARASGARCGSSPATPTPATCSATPTRCATRSRSCTSTAPPRAATRRAITVTHLAPGPSDRGGRGARRARARRAPRSTSAATASWPRPASRPRSSASPTPTGRSR